MDADLAQVLGLILEKLAKLEANTHIGMAAPPPVGTLHVPLVDGEVEVRPTGVKANGVVRYWPATKVFTNEKGAKSGDINYFSYLNRMMETVDPVTKTFFATPGQWGNALNPVQYADDPSFQVRADRHFHPGDWQTQAEIDYAEKMAARDAGLSWGAQPADVPIAGQ